jgi:hypothetical protein
MMLRRRPLDPAKSLGDLTLRRLACPNTQPAPVGPSVMGGRDDHRVCPRPFEHVNAKPLIVNRHFDSCETRFEHDALYLGWPGSSTAMRLAPCFRSLRAAILSP